jgi:MutS domain V
MPNAPSPSIQDPELEYRSRLAFLRDLEAGQSQKDSRLAYATMAVVVGGLAAAIWILAVRIRLIYWVLAPFALFIFFIVIHERVLQALRITRRAITYYEGRLARIAGQWSGKGKTGEVFLNSSHPYARDLDLFGSGSLFELVCSARTLAGEETLAQWLMAPAEPAEVQIRQQAIAEIRDRLDFREGLAVLGDDIRSTVQSNRLAAWGEGKPVLRPGSARVALALLSISFIMGLVAWAAWDFKFLVFFAAFINAGLAYSFRRRAGESASSIETAAHDLRLLASVFGKLENETFSTPKLASLQRSLLGSDLSASRSIKQLARRFEFLISNRNHVLKMVDPFILWSLQCCFAIEAWRERHGPSIRLWLDAVGELEALSDLAAYAYEHPSDVFPEFVDAGPLFKAEGLAHPLIPEARAARNDLSLSRDFQIMIISGPNMAGKSTLVRAVGVNAVLAQCGAPVRARRLHLSRLAVGASVCVLDSLQGGISRFYAEIARLKQIVDLTNGPLPVLFLLDELLQGTNSHDRQAGAKAVARILLERGAVGLITTHDLALTEIAESYRPRSGNFHFEDSVQNGKLEFDYHLTPGIVQTSNALLLMRSIGLDV